MNLESLKYFRYIAKYKNITNAAKRLYVSQSTLSRHIMALENEIGVKLFDRNNKQIELTEAGEVFYKDSASFVNHMEAVIKNVQYADKGTTGILRITLPNNLHDVLTVPSGILRETHPFVRLVLESYDFNEIPSAIKYNFYHVGFTYDFALLERESMGEESMECVPIKTDNLTLIVPAKCIAADLKDTISGVVRSLPLILPSYTEPPILKQMLSQLQDYANAKINNTIYVNTTESVMINVSSGLGYGIVPATTHCERNNIAFVEIPNISAQCSIVMLYKKENANELVKQFVNNVKLLNAVNNDCDGCRIKRKS